MPRRRDPCGIVLAVGGALSGERIGGGGVRENGETAVQGDAHRREGPGVVAGEQGGIDGTQAVDQCSPELVVPPHQRGDGRAVTCGGSTRGARYLDPVTQVAQVEIERLGGRQHTRGRRCRRGR